MARELTQADRYDPGRPSLEIEREEILQLVRTANVFKESGKWGYEVKLQYEVADYDGWGGFDLWSSAKAALKRATENEISGVSFTGIPPGWFMVVLEPYGRTTHPIVVWGDPRD